MNERKKRKERKLQTILVEYHLLLQELHLFCLYTIDIYIYIYIYIHM